LTIAACGRSQQSKKNGLSDPALLGIAAFLGGDAAADKLAAHPRSPSVLRNARGAWGGGGAFQKPPTCVQNVCEARGGGRVGCKTGAAARPRPARTAAHSEAGAANELHEPP
jgi:hypothetical protein